MNNKARSKEKSHALSSAYCFPPRMIYQLPTGAHNEVSPFSRFSSSPDSLRGCLGFRTKIHLGHACRLYNDPCCFFMHLSSTFLFDIYYDGNNNTRVDGFKSLRGLSIRTLRYPLFEAAYFSRRDKNTKRSVMRGMCDRKKRFNHAKRSRTHDARL